MWDEVPTVERNGPPYLQSCLFSRVDGPLLGESFTEVLNEWDKGAQIFKVGGTPSWAQDPEYHRCACGADLVYVCQVPESMDFSVVPGQPEQPDNSAFGCDDLFLGNELYLMACPEHCDPAALWPVNQN